MIENLGEKLEAAQNAMVKSRYEAGDGSRFAVRDAYLAGFYAGALFESLSPPSTESEE
jgi:hypothetical protein